MAWLSVVCIRSFSPLLLSEVFVRTLATRVVILIGVTSSVTELRTFSLWVWRVSD